MSVHVLGLGCELVYVLSLGCVLVYVLVYVLIRAWCGVVRYDALACVLMRRAVVCHAVSYVYGYG